MTYDGTAPNGHSRASTISGDGRYVAFDSSATNILNFAQADLFALQQSWGPVYICVIHASVFQADALLQRSLFRPKLMDSLRMALTHG